MSRVWRTIGLLALVVSPTRPAQAQTPWDALGLAHEVERLASRQSLWPGYRPMTIPLAVYDGERTFLFRHPAPPAGFVRDELGAAHVFPGRHPAVSANTSADIGGTMTATVMLPSGAGASLMNLAAVALHEAFHVYQREHHPTWQANEADLFLYPFDDAEQLTLRRLETESLRRALAASDVETSAAWAAAALAHRARRFESLDPTFVAYERGNELNEGLATYVELHAKDAGTVAFPDTGFGATAIRQRGYASGAAMGLLLDRFAPGWTVMFNRSDLPLDAVLLAALPPGRAAAPAGKLASSEIDAISAAARRDVESVRRAMTERRREFDAMAGWQLIIEAADGAPLWPQGFDPLNIERIDGGILHTRFVELGNEAGSVHVLDSADTHIEVVTEGAGDHPVFNGIRRAVVRGLSTPDVSRDADQVKVTAPGVTLDFKGAAAEVVDGVIRCRLRPNTNRPSD